ncbi:MAG: terminase small subunit [Dysosmobacter sp.]|jgi:hypothetical protein|uniref:terminase small subunit n=1 Tax=Dysosmobacter sp. TaxID=2591382 RepID=UPI003D9096CF
MPAGRPKKYTARTLEKAVNRYFKSISCTRDAMDEFGEKIKNDDGEPIQYTAYVRPPSISALCLYLGIEKRTWANYAEQDDMAPVVEKTKARVEAYLEEQLTIREKGVQGIIFNLQNNYGWKQKQEVELGEKTRKEMKNVQSMSLEEKLEACRKAAAMFQGGGGGPDAEDEGGED